jgi:hypothetical protein
MAELQRPVSSKRLDDNNNNNNNNNNDVNFDRKLDIITAAAKPFVKEHLLNRISKKNCQLCYRDIEILEQPEYLAIGKSRYDPEVIAATKKYRERRKKRLNHLRLMRLAMQTVEVTLAITED